MSRIVVAHPSADRYGSDRQLVHTVRAFLDAGHEVTVCLPGEGPLVTMLQDLGVRVRFLDFPVLRKSLLSPSGLLRLVFSSLATAPRMWSILRRDADVLWVNTITMPTWFLLGRLSRRRVIGHVHEAEDDGPRWLRWGLAAPTRFAHRLIVNSAAASAALTTAMPSLQSRIRVVHNGMPGPTQEPVPPRPRLAKDPATLALVARLSPRKGIDVALEAVGFLRQQGQEVQLRICGTVFDGYEWYETQLRERATQADLAGSVEFAGYVDPTWDVLADADVVLVPSRVEPFGNTAVEAMLAARPLVVSATQGLREIVTEEQTGLLVAPDDPAALAAAIERYLDDPEFAKTVAAQARSEAVDRFSESAYASAVLTALR